MHDYGWFQVVPVAKLGLGFLEATELVSTHPPASRFQIFIVVSSTSLGKYAFKNVHLVKKKKNSTYCDFNGSFGERAKLDTRVPFATFRRAQFDFCSEI